MNHRPNSVLPRVRQVMVGGAITHPAATPESCCAYLQVAIPDPIDRILRQCRALVRAIEALGAIQLSGPFERALARLLMAAHKRRLRGIVEIAPGWASEEILGASERPGCG